MDDVLFGINLFSMQNDLVSREHPSQELKIVESEVRGFRTIWCAVALEYEQRLLC